MENLRTSTSSSSMQRMLRFQKGIIVLMPELAGRLKRTGGTMHLELTSGAHMSRVISQIHGRTSALKC